MTANITCWCGAVGTYDERCHYVGTEATARRKALLRRNAKEIISCEPLTEEQYVRCYGRGRM